MAYEPILPNGFLFFVRQSRMCDLRKTMKYSNITKQYDIVLHIGYWLTEINVSESGFIE